MRSILNVIFDILTLMALVIAGVGHMLPWFRADPEGTLPVDPTLRPVLAWSLRDIPTVRFDASARTQPSASWLGSAVT